MLNVKAWALSLAAWMVVTFTLCVAGGLVAPGLPIPHRTLELLLPGFKWISVTSFGLGLAETFVYGLYAGWLFAALHNLFNRSKTGPSSSILG